MMLKPENLDSVKEIQCPRKHCKGRLLHGSLTKECPVCGQTFLLGLLFEEKLEEVGFYEKNKNE